MKILINSAHQRFGGAIQVALSFIDECRNFKDTEFYVCVGLGIKNSLNEDEFPENFTFEYFDFGAISFYTTFVIDKTLKSVEHRVKPDVIISTSGPTYFHSKAPQIIGYNLPLYIYPESPFLQKQSLYRKLRRFLKKHSHFYYFKRDADYYVVQTDDVNERVRKALGTDRVKTVTNTASNYYRAWKAYPARLAEKKVEAFRFVTISSYYAHKNLELIPKISQELKKRGVNNVEFILTLNDADYQKIAQGDPNIKTVGPVKPEECPSLYKECQAMFLPTLAECFSASYPEAMIMERPIITTDLGFARSICGEAALFYKAMDPMDAADQIVKLIKDQSLQEDLISLGKKQLKYFDSPKQRALKYLNLCAEIRENKN